MSLADELAQRKARVAVARMRDQEVEAKLDQFIAANPQALERYSAMSKEDLIRKLMSEQMENQEAAKLRNREIEPWVREHPEIVAKIENRLRMEAAEHQRRIGQLQKIGHQPPNHGTRNRL